MLLLRPFLKDCKAGVAPMLALAAIPLVGAVGAAVDYSRANAARTSMQGALDATALVLAKAQSAGQQNTIDATTYFNANFDRPEVRSLSVHAAASTQSGG